MLTSKLENTVHVVHHELWSAPYVADGLHIDKLMHIRLADNGLMVLSAGGAIFINLWFFLHRTSSNLMMSDSEHDYRHPRKTFKSANHKCPVEGCKKFCKTSGRLRRHISAKHEPTRARPLADILAFLEMPTHASPPATPPNDNDAQEPTIEPCSPTFSCRRFSSSFMLWFSTRIIIAFTASTITTARPRHPHWMSPITWWYIASI